MDMMLETASASARQLRDGLEAIIVHPRCRLPKADVQARLTRYAALVENE